ncbi:MAG: hypothetical protein WCK70_14625 [Chloroflexales bacterium]
MSQPEDKDSTNQPHSDIAGELRELGQQIEQAVRSALETERAQQLQRDIAAGMKEIGTQMQSALRSIQEDERIKSLAERGQQAISQAQQSQSAKDFQEAFTRGISQLNDQMAAFVTRLQHPSDDSPTTGETTPLDKDKQ